MTESKNKEANIRWLLYAAWIVAVVATLGSLYFSEIKGYIPCELCWYQRILMYPMVVILGMAVFFAELNVRKYGIVLAVIGSFISLHHYLLEKVPGYGGFMTCSQGVPCNQEHINWLGFITIPFLALTAFLLIIGLLSYSYIRERQSK
jgi:disulfide bond formation protein DsbB